MEICKYCGRSFKNKRSCVIHEKYHCNLNPNKLPSNKKNNLKDYIKPKEGGWECRYCGKIFRVKSELYNHYNSYHNELYIIDKSHAWNKGLTYDSNESVRRSVDTRKERRELGYYSNNKKVLSEDTKKKISESMKIAHKEGRAHNIGSDRRNNKPSYPEKYFIDVINNNFSDKNYIREYSFGRYSLDFAWIDKKKCIEIDGDQHYRFEYQINNDKKKDQLLKDNNWEILRIRWKDLYNSPSEWIKKAIDFIGK